MEPDLEPDLDFFDFDAVTVFFDDAMTWALLVMPGFGNRDEGRERYALPVRSPAHLPAQVTIPSGGGQTAKCATPQSLRDVFGCQTPPLALSRGRAPV